MTEKFNSEAEYANGRNNAFQYNTNQYEIDSNAISNDYHENGQTETDSSYVNAMDCNIKHDVPDEVRNFDRKCVSFRSKLFSFRSL
jgi:antitoxin component YwqK of YwqJK toxin-antitoxin module